MHQQKGVGDAGWRTCRVGRARCCPLSEAPLTWLLMNHSFFILFFSRDKSQPTPRYGLLTVIMMNPFISCNKLAGEVIYPRFAGELYTGGGGRRHGDEALRVTETLSHTGGREDATKSRKSPSISDDFLSISLQNPAGILLAGAQA